MYIRQIDYGLRRYLIPLLGLFIIVLSCFSLFGREKLPLLDYEGFSVYDSLAFIVGVFFILLGLYQFFKDDRIVFGENSFESSKKKVKVPYSEVNYITASNPISIIHTSKGDFSIVNAIVSNGPVIERFMRDELGFKLVKRSKLGSVLLACLLGLIFGGSIFLDKNEAFSQRIANILPLKKIETTQIEGTLVMHSTVSLTKREKDSSLVPFISLHGGIEEYPGIMFNYEMYGLASEIINIKAPLPEESHKKQRVKPGSSSDEVSYTLVKGTKVKIKVRPDDLKRAEVFIADNKNRSLTDQPHNHDRFINFYELAVDDEIIVQKKGLQL